MKHETMIGRRRLLKTAGIGVLAVAGAGLAANGALATPKSTAKAMAGAVGGAPMKSGRVSLKLPEIAENGRTVPLTVSVDSPMTSADYVKKIIVMAEGNPSPQVVEFNLTPNVGKAVISTRVRLGKTQNIIASAIMSDGSVYTGMKKVKVTIGGCGG